MTVKELKEWLTDVPDDAKIVGNFDNTEFPDETYTCEPFYNESKREVTFVLGV